MATNHKRFLLLAGTVIIVLIILMVMLFHNFFSKILVNTNSANANNIIELELMGNPINSFYYTITISQDGQAVYSQGVLSGNKKVEKKREEKRLEKSAIDSLLNEISKSGFFEKDFGDEGACLPDTPILTVSVKTTEKYKTRTGCAGGKLMETATLIRTLFFTP